MTAKPQPSHTEPDESRTNHETRTITTDPSTTRAELIAQAIANMGPLSGEQRELLAALLPPPDIVHRRAHQRRH